MIYVTGDTHGRFIRFASNMFFPEKENLTKNDYVIICGDFGGVWDSDYGRNPELILNPAFDWETEPIDEKIRLDILEKQPFTTLFVSGNHENYDRLRTYSDKEWNGGVVKEIRPSVLLLKRGYVFNIDGKKCFTFGGARSHDIQGGVLNLDDPEFEVKAYNARRMRLPFRINHLSWWKEEMPSKEEMALGLKNLKANDFKVDYIFSHDCAASTLALLSHGTYKVDALNKYLEEVKQKTEYSHWYFGHHHDFININEKETLLFEEILPLDRAITRETSIFNEEYDLAR